MADDERVQQLPASRNLHESLSRAEFLAGRRRHTVVGLDHLLLALGQDSDALAILLACNVNVEALCMDLLRKLGPEAKVLSPNSVPPTLDVTVQNLLAHASAAAQASGQTEIDGAHILSAIISGEGGLITHKILERHGLTFEEALKNLQAAHPPKQEEKPQDQPPAKPQKQSKPVLKVKPASEAGQKPKQKIAFNPKTTNQQLPTNIEKAPPSSQGAEEQAADIYQDTIIQAEAHPSDYGLSPEGQGDRSTPPIPEESSLKQSPRPKEPIRKADPKPEQPVKQEQDPAGNAIGRLQEKTAKTHQGQLQGKTQKPNFPPDTPKGPHSHRAPGQETPPPLPLDQSQSGKPPQEKEPPRSFMPGTDPRSHFPKSPVEGNAPPYNPAQPLGAQGQPHPAEFAPQPRPPHLQNPVPPGPPPAQAYHQTPPSDPQTTFETVGTSMQRTVQGLSDGNPDDLVIENIPKVMRAGKVHYVEVRVARFASAELDFGPDNYGLRAKEEAKPITKAITVRLTGPDTQFLIDASTASTQWSEVHKSVIDEADFAIWRWRVVPRKSGIAKLRLDVSVRSSSEDGLTAEIPVQPSKSYDIKITPNYLKIFKRLAIVALIFALGFAIAQYGQLVVTQVQSTIEQMSAEEE